MFDFGIFISLICAIAIFYFGFLLQFQKQKDEIQTDLSQYVKEYESFSQIQTQEREKSFAKINNLHHKKSIIEKKLISLNIISFSFTGIICFFYFLPSITILLNNIFNFICAFKFSNIFKFIGKIFPFKENFFCNHNFTISYITGIIFSIFLCIIWWTALNNWLYENYLVQGIIIILLVFGLIWLNYFISIALTRCFTRYFIPLSIFINIVIYSMLCIVVYFIIYLFDEYL